MVLEFLGQAGLRRRHRRKAPPIPMAIALTTPSPKKLTLERHGGQRGLLKQGTPEVNLAMKDYGNAIIDYEH